jgi:two-component system, NarL family, nitrate/nitrite response regulator NarL
MIQTSANTVAEKDLGEKAGPSGAKILAILIGESSLLGTGLKHLLAGERFFVTEMACGGELPELPEGGPVLFIVSASHWSDETLETIGRLKARCSSGRVCMLADHFDINRVMEAYEAGVDGFCLMTADRDVLTRSLELIALGEGILPSKIVQSILARMSREPETHRHSFTNRTKVAAPIAHKLSVREGEILRGLMEGEPNKVIARRFGLSEATVKVHVKAILRKIGAKNRTQAAMWASDHIASDEDGAVAGHAGHGIANDHYSYAR